MWGLFEEILFFLDIKELKNKVFYVLDYIFKNFGVVEGLGILDINLVEIFKKYFYMYKVVSVEELYVIV